MEDVSTSSRPSRRQKIAAACDECRAKKIKCDGRRQVCGPCRRRFGPDAACKWGIRKVRSGGASKEELVRLGRRIEQLENATMLKHSELAGVEEMASESSGNIPNERAEGEHVPETPAMMGLTADSGSTASSHSLRNNHYSNFRATSFVELLMSAIDGPSATVESFHGQNRHGTYFNPRGGSRKRELQDYVLPPRPRADHLVSIYWRLVHSLYPCLDADEFEHLYRKVWSGENLGPEASTFLCLLNVIFSQGCNFDATVAPEMRPKNAAAFYERAQELLSPQTLRYPTLLTVQCYLLLGQYLQSTNDPQFCWIVVGTAIRLAQSLGLDVETSKAFDRNEQTRRCVWHGCVIMDKTLSTVFGRPPIISRRDAMSVPLPAPHGSGRRCNCYEETCPSTEDGSCTHFFVESLKLFDLIGNSRDALDEPPTPDVRRTDDLPVWPTSCISPRALSAILDMDRAMWAWTQALPLHLRPETNAKHSKIQIRQTNVLFLRHRLLRLLLFRPILARVCYASQGVKPAKTLETTLTLNITLECAVTCVRTALEIIEFFENVFSAHGATELDELLSSWWYNIFYLYSAATVLVAGRLHPLIAVAVSMKALQDGVKSSLLSLSRFFSHSNHAAKSARIIGQLFEKAGQRHINKSIGEELMSAGHSRDTSQRPGHDEAPGLRATLAGERFNEVSQACHSATMLADGACLATSDNDGYRELNDSFRCFENFGLIAPEDLGGDFSDMAWLTSFPPGADNFDPLVPGLSNVDPNNTAWLANFPPEAWR